MRLRVLIWNLKHGRSVPPAGGDLEPRFAAALAAWAWDVALLQEVPPWWPAALATELGPGTSARYVLTSRNALLPVRRPLAIRWPDAIKSNGGGANAILVRGLQIGEHRTLRLCRLPERRWLHAVKLAAPAADASGVWVGNLHASTRPVAESGHEFELARTAMLDWAAGEPAVIGGDFNVGSLYLAGFTHAARNGVDHVFAAGMRAAGPVEVLDRGQLSDHAPVAVTLEP
jgi:endonuclease/exonuclease/phosphatase family metal-dependent hydrolase